MDWNRVNNELSAAILEADRLDELFAQLGIDLRRASGGHVYRGRCPVHLGDGPNCEVRTHGHPLPVRWKCYSRHCEQRFKPSLLGLVRGVLSEGETKEVSPRAALAYLTKFAGVAPSPARRRPQPPPPPPRRLALDRAKVRERLTIPSPYFVARGFSPAVLDVLDVGHSPKLHRSVVPVFDDDGILCDGYMARTENPQCPACKNITSWIRPVATGSRSGPS